jgi:hypothetical protein
MKRRKLSAAFRRPKDQRKLENAKSCSNGSLLDVDGVDRNLVICPHKFNFGKGGGNGKAVSVVLYVWNWITIRDRPSVQSSNLHKASNRCPWARDGGRMTMSPLHIWRYRPAA